MLDTDAMIVQHHPGVVVLHESGGRAYRAALGENPFEPVPHIDVAGRAGDGPVATKIIDREAVVKAFLHSAAAVGHARAYEADLPFRGDHQFRVIFQKIHLHIHRQDGVCVGVEIGPLGHTLKELIEGRVVDGRVAQEVEGSAELLPEISFQPFKFPLHIQILLGSIVILEGGDVIVGQHVARDDEFVYLGGEFI